MLRFLRFLLVAALPAAAFAADPSLVRLVMPDAKVVAGLQVAQAKNSTFGQYVLSHMQVENAGFQRFVSETGFDPRRDVTEILIASNCQSPNAESRWLVAARGSFNLAKIASAAQASGATIVKFQGVDILVYSEPSSPSAQNGIAFFDSSRTVMGDVASVEAAIERGQSNAEPNAALLDKVRDVSASNDFWFVTLVPLSEFSGAVSDPNVSGAMKGNLLTAINQASGGVKFGDTVRVSAEAVTRSEKDAQALVDVVKFLASLLQTNRQNDPAAGQVATVLDSLDTKTSGKTMTMTIAIPEQQLEQLFQSVRQGTQQARKKSVQ